MRPVARLTEGNGRFGTYARASSSSASPPSLNVITAGYLRVALMACCSTTAWMASAERYAVSPGTTSRLGVRISVTAEVSATAMTTSCATGSSPVFVLAPAALGLGSFTTSFSPSVRPELRPPSKYAESCSTNLTWNSVRIPGLATATRALISCTEFGSAPAFADAGSSVAAEFVSLVVSSGLAVEVGVVLARSAEVVSEGAGRGETSIEARAGLADSGEFSATTAASDLGAAGFAWTGLLGGKAVVTGFARFAVWADGSSEEPSFIAVPGN